jgi:CheY-like chemotaxis protein
MNLLRNYVLVLDQQSDDLQTLESSLEQLSCSIVVTHSAEQMLAKATQSTPTLVILSGNDYEWSPALRKGLRHMAETRGVMIVALTDCHAPSWLRQEENPGLDGFLVKPLSCDVLTSLVQSAWIRQACYISAAN